MTTNRKWLAKEDKNLGRTWNSLTAVELVERLGYHRKYLFVCTCGNTRVVRLANVASGQTKACKDCIAQAREERLNDSYSPLHARWRAMRWRVKNLQVYKQRQCCERWQHFEQFKEDMGEGYFEGAVLDRKDNTKGYSKDNCQWLTKVEHAYKTWEERRYG